MNGWFVAAILIAVTGVAMIVASPSWMSTSCPGTADACGSVSPFFVGFLTFLGTFSCALWGFVYRARTARWEAFDRPRPSRDGSGPG